MICWGTGQLKWFFELTVTFKTYQTDYLKKDSVVPDDLIRECQATNVFPEQNNRVGLKIKLDYYYHHYYTIIRFSFRIKLCRGQLCWQLS